METKALIIGKFMPLHKGHVAMIRWAAEHYDNVNVCILYHEHEPIRLVYRSEWVKEEFSNLCNVRIDTLKFDPNKLNSSSESDLVSSQQWWDYLSRYYPDITHIIGSEKYVQYMAEYGGKEYVIYDEKRNNVHISASEIRKDFITNWHYLADSVRRDLALHICICGTESSGKTTLCNSVDKDYDSVTVIPEIGRCLIGNANSMSFDDLLTNYKIHNNLLDAAKRMNPTPIMLWDTDNITTLSYCKHFIDDELFSYSSFMCGQFAPVIANKYIFLEGNVYDMEPGRISENEADELKNTHIKMYNKFNIKLRNIKNIGGYNLVTKMIKEHLDYISQILGKNVEYV